MRETVENTAFERNYIFLHLLFSFSLLCFRGDLTIVGPRAERPELAAEYEQELPEFGLRLQAKAGLTGYAQVYGKYNTTPYDKLLMDLMYIANASIFEDLRIEPGMYENLLKGLEETDSDVCVCDYCLEPAKYKMNHQSGVVIYQDADAVKALMDGKINNFVWNKLYRKEVFKDILFPVGKNYEDIAIMHRILFKAERVAVIPNVEYHYCLRFDSITRIHSAKNMLDYAEAFLKRYYFLSNCQNKSFSYKQQEIMRLPAIGISAVWRWWYGCSLAEKKAYKGKVDDLLKLSREHFPMFGYSSWPVYLRISTVFMHSGSNMSFAVLYGLNQLYRRIRLGKK